MSYELSAPYYDAIYTAMKDYRAEAERVRELIESNTRRPVRRLFDVAGGTGLHSQYLRDIYDVTLIDLSEAQLAIARQRLTGTPIVLADMTTFNLGYQADAIVCLFSAIGHLPAVAKLRQAIANFSDQLKPGGVILIEPWLLPHMWMPGKISLNVIDLPEMKIVRLNRSSRAGNLIRLDFEFLVGRPEGNEHFRETHDVMMFTEAEFAEAFAAAGLESYYDPAGISDNGRGVFIATKPLE